MHIVGKKHERKKLTAQAPCVKIEYLSGQCASGHLRVRVQLGTDAALLSEPEQGLADNPHQFVCMNGRTPIIQNGLGGSSLDTRRGLAFATRAPGP